jgi:hypothetical protein
MQFERPSGCVQSKQIKSASKTADSVSQIASGLQHWLGTKPRRVQTASRAVNGSGQTGRLAERVVFLYSRFPFCLSMMRSCLCQSAGRLAWTAAEPAARDASMCSGTPDGVSRHIGRGPWRLRGCGGLLLLRRTRPAAAAGSGVGRERRAAADGRLDAARPRASDGSSEIRVPKNRSA